jgi:hypothetical protein
MLLSLEFRIYHNHCMDDLCILQYIRSFICDQYHARTNECENGRDVG